ncbi:hypothetical protein [uncultured Corynebacterium sp.]|uniref:hypothetical protein n=1 Tax=uncultured Corynebacterium sp. TaxID=159447 RepID=UPI0025DCB52D|nr:hypothetical protein [uncultured Corynebacterium sp.]
MAIKLTVDLSDATFAEMAAVIGYAHQLGVDPDEKLTFEGTVLTIEFDADLQHDDLFMNLGEGLDDDDIEVSGDDPLYVEDLLSDEEMGDLGAEEEYRARHPRRDNPTADDVINDIGEAVNKIVTGFMGGRNGRNGRGYGDFGGFGGGFPGAAGPFGPFGPFGPRGPRNPRDRY